jgi:redox-sensitive bicupin YhaK (pirin superfamily)
MVAGTGIAHSERSPNARRQSSHSVHGLQLWQGLPTEQEETTASFHHYPVEDIPAITQNGVQKRILIGEAFGLKSPVQTFTQTLYVEYQLQSGQLAAVPEGVEELAVYAVDSRLRVDNEILPPRRLALLPAQTRHIYAENITRVVFIGGQPLSKRYMWWNFVSSRKERIQKAMDDWKQGHFGAVHDDNGTPAPLPESDLYSLMSD